MIFSPRIQKLSRNLSILGEGTDFVRAQNQGEDGGALDFTLSHILRSIATRATVIRN